MTAKKEHIIYMYTYDFQYTHAPSCFSVLSDLYTNKIDHNSENRYKATLNVNYM